MSLQRVLAGVPFGIEDFDAASKAAAAELLKIGVPESHHDEWLTESLARWRDDVSVVDPQLLKVVSAALCKGIVIDRAQAPELDKNLTPARVKALVECLVDEYRLGWDGAGQVT